MASASSPLNGINDNSKIDENENEWVHLTAPTPTSDAKEISIKWLKEEENDTSSMGSHPHPHLEQQQNPSITNNMPTTTTTTTIASTAAANANTNANANVNGNTITTLPQKSSSSTRIGADIDLNRIMSSEITIRGQRSTSNILSSHEALYLLNEARDINSHTPRPFISARSHSFISNPTPTTTDTPNTTNPPIRPGSPNGSVIAPSSALDRPSHGTPTPIRRKLSRNGSSGDEMNPGSSRGSIHSMGHPTNRTSINDLNNISTAPTRRSSANLYNSNNNSTVMDPLAASLTDLRSRSIITIPSSTPRLSLIDLSPSGVSSSSAVVSPSVSILMTTSPINHSSSYSSTSTTSSSSGGGVTGTGGVTGGVGGKHISSVLSSSSQDMNSVMHHSHQHIPNKSWDKPDAWSRRANIDGAPTPPRRQSGGTSLPRPTFDPAALMLTSSSSLSSRSGIRLSTEGLNNGNSSFGSLTSINLPRKTSGSGSGIGIQRSSLLDSSSFNNLSNAISYRRRSGGELSLPKPTFDPHTILSNNNNSYNMNSSTNGNNNGSNNNGNSNAIHLHHAGSTTLTVIENLKEILSPSSSLSSCVSNALSSPSTTIVATSSPSKINTKPTKLPLAVALTHHVAKTSPNDATTSLSTTTTKIPTPITATTTSIPTTNATTDSLTSGSQKMVPIYSPPLSPISATLNPPSPSLGPIRTGSSEENLNGSPSSRRKNMVVRKYGKSEDSINHSSLNSNLMNSTAAVASMVLGKDDSVNPSNDKSSSSISTSISTSSADGTKKIEAITTSIDESNPTSSTITNSITNSITTVLPSAAVVALQNSHQSSQGSESPSVPRRTNKTLIRQGSHGSSHDLFSNNNNNNNNNNVNTTGISNTVDVNNKMTNGINVKSLLNSSLGRGL